MRAHLTTIVVMSIALGCGDTGSNVDSGDLPAASMPRPGGGELQFERTGQGVQGTFSYDGHSVAFQSEMIAPRTFDMWVQVNDKTLTSVWVTGLLAVDYDGFDANGDDIQLTDEDRALCNALAFKLGEAFASEQRTPGDMLYRAATAWGSFPRRSDARIEVLSDLARGTDNICSSKFLLFQTTHSCADYNENDPHNTRQTQIAYRGNDYQEYCATTYWTTNETYESHDYTYYPKMTGGCIGNCGANCPSCSNNQILTRDCAKHDLCVIMHEQNDGPCADELTATLDDLDEDNCNNTKCENETTSMKAHCAAIFVDDNAAGVTYSGFTYAGGATNFYNLTKHTATSSSAWAQYTFNSSRITVYGLKGPAQGKFDVYIDGVKQATIDTYKSTTEYQAWWWDKIFPIAASHTVKIMPNGKNASSTGYQIALDKFRYDQL